MDIETIYNSLVNGQRRQMVEQIDEYGVYDFWPDFADHLSTIEDEQDAYGDFKDAVISYHRINGR